MAADRVKLFVWLPSVSSSREVVDPFWVYIHVESGMKLDDPIVDTVKGSGVASVSPTGGQDIGPFKGYFISNLKDKCVYRMTIKATDPSNRRDLAHHVSIFTRRRPRYGERRDQERAIINVLAPTPWPGTMAQPTPVQANFVTSGTVDPSTAAMAAWVTDANHKTVAGMPCPIPPGCDWAFQFQNLAAGPYTLTIQATTDQVTQETGYIQV